MTESNDVYVDADTQEDRQRRLVKAMGILKEDTNRYSYVPPEPKKKGRYDRE